MSARAAPAGPVHTPIDDLQARLGHRFARPELLARALTHRSYGADHNERLEYLGDAVLNLAVAHLLYEALAGQPEGELSRVRASLVRQDTLHRLATGLGLPTAIRLGAGELRSGGRQRPSILADTLEAVIGAVYLDAGHAAADALVRRLFARIEITPRMQAAAKDAKTALQEWLQGQRRPLPRYTVAGVQGADHQQTFEVDCHVSDLALVRRGTGPSRRAAEQAAAAAMLHALRHPAPDAPDAHPQPGSRCRH